MDISQEIKIYTLRYTDTQTCTHRQLQRYQTVSILPLYRLTLRALIVICTSFFLIAHIYFYKTNHMDFASQHLSNMPFHYFFTSCLHYLLNFLSSWHNNVQVDVTCLSISFISNNFYFYCIFLFLMYISFIKLHLRSPNAIFIFKDLTPIKILSQSRYALPSTKIRLYKIHVKLLNTYEFFMVWALKIF